MAPFVVPAGFSRCGGAASVRRASGPLALVLVLTLALPVLAETLPPQPRVPGIETPGYVWNQPNDEQIRALAHRADRENGQIAYEVCQGCHKENASGRVDGRYPLLAGQHATVLIKQMVDVRAGRRDNPKMHPFVADWVVSPEEVADIAAYLSSLPVPDANGQGEGAALDAGRRLYQRDCVRCHGERGEGIAADFYPRVARQHYRYLYRESRMIRDGERRNANPEMVDVIRAYSDDELRAVSDFMSRL